MKRLFILILAALIFSCGHQKNRLTILFDRVDNTEVGSPVKVKGVTIGEVTRLKLVDEGVLVSIRFNKKRNIPKDSKFSIETPLIGLGTVIIEPGTQKEFLTSRDTVVGIYNAAKAFALDSALQEKIKEDAKDLIKDLRDAFQTKKDSSK